MRPVDDVIALIDVVLDVVAYADAPSHVSGPGHSAPLVLELFYLCCPAAPLCSVLSPAPRCPPPLLKQRIGVVPPRTQKSSNWYLSTIKSLPEKAYCTQNETGEY